MSFVSIKYCFSVNKYPWFYESKFELSPHMSMGLVSVMFIEEYKNGR
jgi:hypothetical protein